MWTAGIAFAGGSALQKKKKKKNLENVPCCTLR
jgi:hypothetical protein